MDMRAYLLPRLRRTKDPDDGECRRVPLLCGAMAPEKWRVEAARRSLIMVDTVQSHAWKPAVSFHLDRFMSVLNGLTYGIGPSAMRVLICCRRQRRKVHLVRTSS